MWRFLAGPRPVDRVVAFDTLTVITVTGFVDDLVLCSAHFRIAADLLAILIQRDLGAPATPDAFDAFRAEARQMGFSGVASGPLVRSSYRADEQAGFVTEGEGDA